MATRSTSTLTGGSNNHKTTSEEANFSQTDFISEGILDSGDFEVSAQSTPEMSVSVAGGVAYVDTTPTGQSSQTLRTTMDAAEDVTISDNSSGSTRYDWLYLKHDADNANDPNTAGDNVATLVTSRSTSSSSDDGTPPTYGILFAVITVANGATEITSGNITDKRTTSGISQHAEGSVASEKLSATIATSVNNSDGQTVSPSSHEKVGLSDVNFDKNGDWDADNNEFVAPRDGVYFVAFAVEVNAASDSTRCLLRYRVNGSTVRNIPNILSGSTNVTTLGNAMVDVAQGDKLSFTFWHNNGSSQELQSGSYMEVYYIG